MFRPLTGFYEPSAIQQLGDGRFLVVEDEKEYSFSLVRLHADGRIEATPLYALPGSPRGAIWKLEDLEGLARDGAGFVYAITSHSRDDEGDKKKSRERLVRFGIEGDCIVTPVAAKGLKRALIAAHPVLAAAARDRDAKSGHGLNIEALEMSLDQQQLLLGFRSPLHDGQAIIACIDNTAAVFDNAEAPRISPRLTLLDLDGCGIRGMSWVPALQGYLIISGPVGHEPVSFDLWFWSGLNGDRTRRVTVAGLQGFERAEGVSPATIDGKDWIVIVSDDGSRKKGRPARYVLLEPGQLKIPG